MLEFIEARDMIGLYNYAIVRLLIILLCWFFVIVANVIDLLSRRETEKALGRRLTSKGYRRTFRKIGDYYKLLIFFLMFDILAGLMSFYILPFLTMIGSVAVLFNEGKSVVENSQERKSRAADIPELVRKIVQCSTAQKGQELLDMIKAMSDENENK